VAGHTAMARSRVLGAGPEESSQRDDRAGELGEGKGPHALAGWARAARRDRRAARGAGGLSGAPGRLLETGAAMPDLVLLGADGDGATELRELSRVRSGLSACR